MNTAASSDPRIEEVRVTDDEIIAHLVDGRVISVPLAWSWRLSEATPAQRARFRLIGRGQGVHWPDVDEDVRQAAEAGQRAVAEALAAGKISPAQKEWALEYFRQAPDGFATYVARAPKLVPVGELLSLVGEDRGGTSELLPEELAICRSLNLAPEDYLKAKDQAA